MKTHDKILIESLKLFAIKGYSDVFLNDIAEKVGCIRNNYQDIIVMKVLI